MSEYIVYRKNPQSSKEVGMAFHEHLDEALVFLKYKEAMTRQAWGVAQVIPNDSRWFKLFMWLTEKFD